MIIIPSILDTIKASEVQREFSITGIHVFLGNDIIRWELERSFLASVILPQGPPDRTSLKQKEGNYSRC